MASGHPLVPGWATVSAPVSGVPSPAASGRRRPSSGVPSPAASGRALVHDSSHGTLGRNSSRAMLEAERDQNRALLRNTVNQEVLDEEDVAGIHKQIASMKSEVNALYEKLGVSISAATSAHDMLQQDHAKLQEQARVLSDLKDNFGTDVKNLQDLKGEVHSISQELKQDVAGVAEVRRKLGSETTALQQLTQDVAQLKKQVRDGPPEVKQNASALQAMRQELVELKQIKPDLAKMRGEITRIKQEIQENKGLKPEIAKLREGLKSNDELTRLKSQCELTAAEFRDFKKLIFDSGVLAPPHEEPPSEDSPPVGSLELGEDIFAARLLLRLGFMKGDVERDDDVDTLESPQEFRRVYCEEREESNPLEPDKVFEGVTGLMVPEVEEGGWAYCEMTSGWLVVCLVTIVVQLLSLTVMLRSWMEQSGQCFEGSELSWWLLHLSRCMATVVAGVLMTKELMDTINYFMISELLEPRLSIEVLLTTFVRLVMQSLVIAASAFLFLSSSDPAETWMNMTALGFIATLGVDVLEVAKRGVFGHHIQGAITDLNYNLSIDHEYPSWFGTVRWLTLLASVCGIVVFSVYIFLREDPPCEHPTSGVTSGNSTMLAHLSQDHHHHHGHHR